MHTDDGHIVHQCLSGNTEAFALLVDKDKARLFAVVYTKVGQFEDAEDITQDVFLNAYRKLSTLRRWDNFYAWLYSIASNRCKEFHRAKGRRLDVAYLADQSENYQADMDAHAEKLRNEQIHEALDSLSEIHRQVLVLRYMAGMRSKEIARTLRVSPNTVNQRLLRARTQLKAVLSEEAIPMIPTAFADRKLQPGFTVRILELIKGTQIQSAPHKTALPFGLSAAGAVIVLLLRLVIPQSPLYPVGEWLGGPLPLNTRVFENGELAVDAQATEVAILSGEQRANGLRKQEKTVQVPSITGENAKSDEKEKAITSIYLPKDASWDLDISPDGTKMAYPGRGVTPSGYEFQLIVSPLVDVSGEVPPTQTVLVHGEKTTQYFQPKWSPNGKWIAFFRQDNQHQGGEDHGSDIDVYLVPAAGGNARFLARTDSQQRMGGFSWSPDSKNIAFVKWTAENADIYIVSIATGIVRPFTADGKGNISPSWSPDGKWIFYLSQRASSRDTGFGSRPVWKQPVDGGNATRINVVDHQHPLISSPNQKWIAHNYVVGQDGEFLFRGIAVDRLNENGDLVGEPIVIEPAKLKESLKLLRWTSSERIFVLQEDYREMLYATLNTTNGERNYLDIDSTSTNMGFTFISFKNVQWLSGGKRLFFPSDEIFSGKGSHPEYTQIDSRPGILDIETNHFTTMQLPVRTWIHEFALSPDEKRIAFVRTVSGNRLLYIMPVGGRTPHQLTRDQLLPYDLRWSPDGQTIAFTNRIRGTTEGPESQLCAVSVSDGQVKILVDSGLCREPAWSPDGTMLAYTQYPFDDIHIVSATGGDSRQITNTPKQQESELTWTSDGKRLAYKVHGVEWWVVSIDGGKPTKLHRNHIPSSWSSDGTSYLALAPHGELLRISLDGAILSELSVRAPMHAQPLSISPDGETILIWHVDSEKSCWGIDVSHLDGL